MRKKNRERYQGPITGKDRIADISTPTVFAEIKNIGSKTIQCLSSQIKDGIAHAKNTFRQYVLKLPEGAKVTKPLQNQIDGGKVKRVNINDQH